MKTPRASAPMRARTFVLLFCFAGCCANEAIGQGFFGNVGFEYTTIPPGTPPSSPTSPASFTAAFPGWTGTVDGVAQSTALYNNLAGSTSGFALIGSDSPVGYTYEGNYTAVLQAHSRSLSPSETSLFQNGNIPLDARSLRFLGTTPLNLFQGQLAVSLNGTPLGLMVLQDFGTNALYAADISSFAGQSAELRFTDSVGAFGNSDFGLDAISFSPITVPEPSALALLGLGTLIGYLFMRRRRERKRSRISFSRSD